MSELTWSDRLNFVRFSRAILLFEKWFSILILCWLGLFTHSPVFVLFCSIVFFGMFLLNFTNHYHLERAAGLPSQQLVIAY